MAATIEKIKELRDRTGVGMGKCKEALVEVNGDIESAIKYLREKGIASAVKKEGRAANEGVIKTKETADHVVLVEVNAETDFVVQNDKFQEFIREIADEIAATKPSSLETFLQQKYSKDDSMTIDEYRATIIQMIGENIQIRRLAVIPKAGEKSIGVYSHLGGKIVTMVEIAGNENESELAKNISMHIAAAHPEYISQEMIPEDVINNEKDIARSQIEGKPDHIKDKIIEGKLKAFYDQVCLLNQKYIKDDTLTISQLVEQHAKASGKQLSVTQFTRWSVGK